MLEGIVTASCNKLLNLCLKPIFSLGQYGVEQALEERPSEQPHKLHTNAHTKYKITGDRAVLPHYSYDIWHVAHRGKWQIWFSVVESDKAVTVVDVPLNEQAGRKG